MVHDTICSVPSNDYIRPKSYLSPTVIAREPATPGENSCLIILLAQYMNLSSRYSLLSLDNGLVNKSARLVFVSSLAILIVPLAHASLTRW